MARVEATCDRRTTQRFGYSPQRRRRGSVSAVTRLMFRKAGESDAAAVADLRTAAARDLTTRFGRGHWSSEPTQRGVMSGMRGAEIWVGKRAGVPVATFRVTTRKPWAIDPSTHTMLKRELEGSMSGADSGMLRVSRIAEWRCGTTNAMSARRQASRLAADRHGIGRGRGHGHGQGLNDPPPANPRTAASRTSGSFELSRPVSVACDRSPDFIRARTSARRT